MNYMMFQDFMAIFQQGAKERPCSVLVLQHTFVFVFLFLKKHITMRPETQYILVVNKQLPFFQPTCEMPHKADHNS